MVKDIKVGQVYRTKNGRPIHIDSVSPIDGRYAVKGLIEGNPDLPIWYSKEGLCVDDHLSNYNYNLVELVEDVAPPINPRVEAPFRYEQSFLPKSALDAMYHAFKVGEKYGKYSYIESNKYKSCSEHFDAAVRHLFKFFYERETHCHKDGQPHLGSVLARVSILVDLEARGLLVDDRPPVNNLRGGSEETVSCLDERTGQVDTFIVKPKC